MHQQLRLALATAATVALTGGLLTVAATGATAADATHVAQADFNGDGIGDIATAAPDAYVSGHKEAGQIVALYGSATGVSSAHHSTISQNTTGVPGTSEAGDYFGWTTAYADFNGDGYDDLVVGAPGEKVGTDTDGGMISLLYGSAKGLTGKAVTIADPAPTAHDAWGSSLAAGDFDGDGKADLAVGSSNSTVYVIKGGVTSAGKGGLGSYTVKAPILTGGGIGTINLTAGDVTGDGRTDLVVDGFENTTATNAFNKNYLLLGASGGLKAATAQTLDSGVVTGIGDINGDGYGDIVSGQYWNAKTADGVTFPGGVDGGKVWVTYGTAAGAGSTIGITQNTGAVPGTSEKNDEFGWEIDLGDVNGDGYQDLVIGSPGENMGTVVDAGMVTVLYGSQTGLNTASAAQSFAQSTAGVPGADEKSDLFGSDVKLDDVTGDGRADLLIGSAENTYNGQVLQLKSNGAKIVTTGAVTVSPSTVGVSTTGYPYLGGDFAN
jgi:hypothetical protein